MACGLAIAACYVCSAQRAGGRVVHFNAANQVLVQTLSRPPWTLTVTSDPELSIHGFAFAGQGITIVDSNTLERKRAKRPVTVGAKWSRGVSHGKHVYEVIWPEVHRGVSASVGVGTATAPLFINGKVTLVGMTEGSWGLDIAKKTMFHNSAPGRRCPPNEEDVIPERFFMYVDMDRGELGFGSSSTFWGVMAENIHYLNQPLYVMVGANVSRARLQVFYRGSAMSSAMRDPPTAAMTTSTVPSRSGIDRMKSEDLDLHKRAMYQSIALRHARAQAWAQNSDNERPGPEDATFQLPLSPPPPYSRF
ncbi:SPRY domain-containing SOCS box protein 2-like [Haliotis asinina]|uniref:SPRY domain-containing SOCS box protein 2-like n=1 Tax=Haliotis asinina TaxID=109174 RepID=UPI0035321217